MNTKSLRKSVLPALLLLLLTVGASGGLAAASKPPVAAHPPQPAKADRDGNKVFDDLEAHIASVAPGERIGVLVALNQPATAERVAETSRRAGGLSVGRRFGIVDGFAAMVNKGQLEALTHVPWVTHVELNARVQASNDGAQTAFGVTKARLDAQSLDGDRDGNVGVYSAGDLVAAVIDTGIHAAHLDLDEGKVLAFKDFVNGRTGAYDDNGHGTHVAATIAGDGDARSDRAYAGVAPAAALVGVKVLDAQGGGTMENVTAAIDWVVQNKTTYGIEAINLSLGAAGCANGTDLTSQAVNRAAAAGLVVAVAAGNEGPGKCTVGSPAAASGALTVGAMADTATGGFSLASFSSRGPTADGRVKPDLLAPGVGITSAKTGTTSGYVAFDGTSMATPFVAGVALLALDANATLTAADVKARLTSTTIDWGRTGTDGEHGSGRLDAYAALKAAGATLGTGPVAPQHVVREGKLASTGAWTDVKVEVTDTRFPVAGTLILPDVSAPYVSSPDFDLYLYGPSGALLRAAETVSRQENVTFTPTATGTYTFRIASYSGSGAYLFDASGGFGTASAPVPAPAPAPVTVTATPSSVVLYAGSVRSGGASSLASDDNAYFAVNSTTSGTRQTDWYGRIGGVTNGLKSLKVTFRGKASASCTQAVFVYDWTYGAWTRLDARTVGTTEIQVDLTVGGTLANYVSGSSGDGEVAVRVRCHRGDTLGFFTSADLQRITYER